FEKENMSCNGTRWFLRIHSPVRMCQPVSQSLSSVFTPSIRPNRKAMGTRKAKSASDGSNLMANWWRRASVISGHPGVGDRLHRFEGANPIVKRPKIHIIHAQGDARQFGLRKNPRDCALAMDTLLAEAMVAGQFNFDGKDLTD